MEQRRTGTLAIWAEPFVPLRMPKLFNLRTDPFERADTTSNTYYDWFLSRPYLIAAAGGIVEEFLKTFKEFPPRQRAATFTIDQALEKMESALRAAPAAEHWWRAMSTSVETTERLANAPPRFHLLAKPSGSTCNIDCTYCFFLSKEALVSERKHGCPRRRSMPTSGNYWRRTARPR